MVPPTIHDKQTCFNVDFDSFFKAWKPATLSKRDCNTGVFLRILQIFQKQLYLQNTSVAAFSYVHKSAYYHNETKNSDANIRIKSLWWPAFFFKSFKQVKRKTEIWHWNKRPRLWGILDSSNSQNQFPKCLKQNGFCLNVLT